MNIGPNPTYVPEMGPVGTSSRDQGSAFGFGATTCAIVHFVAPIPDALTAVLAPSNGRANNGVSDWVRQLF